MSTDVIPIGFPDTCRGDQPSRESVGRTLVTAGQKMVLHGKIMMLPDHAMPEAVGVLARMLEFYGDGRSDPGHRHEKDGD